MEQKTYICLILVFGILLHFYLRRDNEYLTTSFFKTFLCGIAIVCIGILAAYLDKGLEVVINNLTMRNVEFPGHPIPFGYLIIIWSFCLAIEKVIIAITRPKHNE